MRIALFTDTYLPTMNGVARTLGHLVRHAFDRGHEVALCSPRLSEEPAEKTAAHHQVWGVPVPFYPELKLCRPVDQKAMRSLEAFRPDLIHVATESTVGWSGRRWALKRRIPLVTSFHTDFPAYLAGYRLGGLEDPLWRYLRFFHAAARITFCPSSATLEQLRRRGLHDRLRIWSRGVDHELFHPARRTSRARERLAPGAERILVYVGRLAPEKRPELLLDAFRIVRESAPARTALVVVGDGPRRKELQRRAGPDVFFTGYLGGIALAEAYAAGDIFAFPSDTETFGNVVAEALSSGLPVVAPAKGGVTDMVSQGVSGILVPPRDPEAFARALLSLLNEEQERLRLSRGARKTALGRSWPEVLDGLLDAYREVLGNPRCRAA